MEEQVDFTTPIILRVWGGDNLNSYYNINISNYSNVHPILLAETTLINHSEWKDYTFTFSPEVEINSIQLEAFYDTGINKKTPNGNILLDNLSPIYSLKCKEVKSFTPIKYEYDPPELHFKRVVAQHGKMVQFELEKLEEFSYHHLFEIGAAFSELENQQLVICLPTKNFDLAAERREEVIYLLTEEVGIDNSQLFIGNYSDFMDDDKWMYISNHIKIGIRGLE